jgi:ubiquinone/menaquinone biosynthesis C-methylase UbiE
LRTVDDDSIKTHGAVRFRSDYHYAVFEYWRSAKLLRYLSQAGVTTLGRVLDDGCGGGGMCVSFGEETPLVVGIDPGERFCTAGRRLAAEQSVTTANFSRADGHCLPFGDGVFDLVLSHAVIEHVADPAQYLREARRVLRPGGLLFLETAPYLSLAGAHLPRLKWPIPYYLPMGRRAAFAFAKWMARHAPQLLKEPPEGSSFITLVRRGEVKEDDLLYRVTLRRLRRDIAGAGFTPVREDLYVSGFVRRRLPAVVSRLVPRMPFARDVLITNMEYLLAA